MAAAGFTLVLNYSQNSGTAEQVLRYLDTAHALGMKVIWAMNNSAFWDGHDLRTLYPELAATCACSDNTGFIAYVVNLVKDSPGLWGYYVGDELHPSAHASWIGFSELVHRLDPSHPRLVVGATQQCGYGNSQLASFADGAEVLGQDYYPIGVSYLVPYTETGAVARGMQTVVSGANRQSAVVLQALSWQQEYPPARCAPYPACAPFPSEAQMREMLRQALQNARPRLVLWYSYFDILSSDHPQQHWDSLVAAVHAVLHVPAPAPAARSQP
jgi:hypothetical protein